jgi:hypothetical protein
MGAAHRDFPNLDRLHIPTDELGSGSGSGKMMSGDGGHGLAAVVKETSEGLAEPSGADYANSKLDWIKRHTAQYYFQSSCTNLKRKEKPCFQLPDFSSA